MKNNSVEDILIQRSESVGNSVCVSGEDIDGVHYQYTSEYLRYNLKSKWVKVTVHLTDEERKQWFIDNKPPENKFRIEKDL